MNKWWRTSSTRRKCEQKAHIVCEVSLPQRGSRKAWSPRRPVAGEKEMDMLRRGSKDCPDPYVKHSCGASQMWARNVSVEEFSTEQREGSWFL